MTRPSLARLFEAPDDQLGLFGWACGYSADALFLNEAAERFTRRTQAQRARDGCVALALMLDPGQTQVSPLDAPGVAHLPMLPQKRQPFALLHAKVALLGFRDIERVDGWRLRLIVSTGNWTCETMEDSLDLAWSIDVGAQELDSGGSDVAQRCADLCAAHDMLQWLEPLFDTRLLHTRVRGEPGLAAQADEQLKSWLARCREVAGRARPRFFDNRELSLLSQLHGQIRAHAGGVRRNYLAMGSGFYESATKPAVPSVLARIVDGLRDEGLLTQTAAVSVFVNEKACQAVANSIELMNQAGWQVYPAGRPEGLYGPDSARTLHAKFIFGTNLRQGSYNCSAPWLYLGSGNLTTPGFIERAAPQRGNLEAGAMLAPQWLVWAHDPDQPDAPVATSLLPIHDGEPLSADAPPAAGADMPQRPQPFLAAPVAWLQWQRDGEHGLLKALDAWQVPMDVLGPDGQPCQVVDGGWRWPGGCPRQACVSWDEGRQQRLVPVLDEFGRIGALPLQPLRLAELAWLLDAFPASDDAQDPGDGDTDGNEPPQDPPHGATGGFSGDTGAAGSYAVRLLMTQLELVARKQCTLDEGDWTAWCLRLEQVLMQASDCPDVHALRQWGLNPLGPLRAGPFRPDFALDSQSAAGRRYEQALDRVELAWNVNGLAALGGWQ